MINIGGNDLSRAILCAFSPLATTVTLANVTESKSENSIIKIAGKILQNIPFTLAVNSIAEDHIEHAFFWHGISEAKFSTVDTSPEAIEWWQSVGTPKERMAFTNFWAPKIIFSITAAILFAPLIFKGLKFLAHKYESPSIESFFDGVEKIFMTSIKVMNLSLMFFGIYIAVTSASPVLAGIYSAFFLMNLYLLFPQNQSQESIS